VFVAWTNFVTIVPGFHKSIFVVTWTTFVTVVQRIHKYFFCYVDNFCGSCSRDP
jgi:hypothetical protein